MDVRMMAKIRACEKNLLGENILSETCILGLAKQIALNHELADNAHWMEHQIRNFAAQLKHPKARELRTQEAEPMACKADVQIKFNQKPVAGSRKGKPLLLMVSDGLEFEIVLNPKSWRKAEQKMQDFDSFIGVISGSLGKGTGRGFQLEGAGIQIFERKSKEDPNPTMH